MATSLWNHDQELPVTGSTVITDPQVGITARRARRRYKVRLGSVEAAMAVVIVALFFVYIGSLLGHTLVRPQQVPVIKVTVEKGDTLWTLSERYGYPEDYILKRVNRLAEYNGMKPGESLRVGDVVRVPVENPTERQALLQTARK